MTLSTSHRQPLADEVTAKLREMIQTGEWPLQQRIPSETELMSGLGVSRGTLREAVKALAHTAMRALLTQRDEAWHAGDYAGWARADWGFHERLAQASGNPLLHELYVSFGDVFHADLLKQHLRPGFNGLPDAGHGELVDAVEAHDGEAAVASVHRNLNSCADWLRE